MTRHINSTHLIDARHRPAPGVILGRQRADHFGRARLVALTGQSGGQPHELALQFARGAPAECAQVRVETGRAAAVRLVNTGDGIGRMDNKVREV